MKQRGRKSAKSQNIVDISQAQRPKPPAELTEKQAKLWRAITADRPAEYFDDASLPLLAEYVRCADELDKIAVTFENFNQDWLKDGDGLMRYRKMTSIRSDMQGRLATLATKLRLAQQSRYDKQKAGARPSSEIKAPKPWEA